MSSHYVDYAVQALTKPDDFGWWGEEEMFDTWGFAGINKTGQNRISDISNWHSAISELKREFGEDVYNENFIEAHMGHWACGSVDQLCVKILNESKPHDEITEEDITPYFKRVLDMALYIHEEYPILDDCDYSDRQWDAASEWIEDLLESDWIPICHHTSFFKGIGAQIQNWLSENYRDPYEYSDDDVPLYHDADIIEAIYDLGFDKRDDDEDEAFWEDWKEKNPAAVEYRRNRYAEEAGQLRLEF